MNDDLNTSVALSVLFELVRDIQKILENGKTSKQTLEAIDDLFSKLGGDVLGIVKDEYEQKSKTDEIKRLEFAVDGLVELRNEARENKNFLQADKIRDILGSVGIILEDTPEGTTWRAK
jgi:cysteinyl-tRNA synthetase